MQAIIKGHRYRYAKSLVVAILVLAHISLVTGVSEVYAMESANFRMNEVAVVSGVGNNSGNGADIAYSSAGESATGNTTSSNYNVALGYISTIVSNPPVFTGLIPDTNMRIIWDQGQSNPTTISLDTYFYSPDNSRLRYEVEGDLKNLVTIDQVSHVATLSSRPDYYGSENIRFVAIDESGKNRTKSNFVTLVVKSTERNNPPVIYSISDISVNENELIQVTPTVFDPDGNPLTVTFTAPLDNTGKWQTTYSDAGTYKVTASVSDSTPNKASATFNITVKNVNRTPEIEAIPDIIIKEGEVAKICVRAPDPDGDNVTISYPAPFDADGGWQTTYRDAGTYHITVTASDGELTATRDVNVTVNNINSKPSVAIYANKTTVSVNEEFSVYVIAQDPDSDQLKLTLKKDGSAVSSAVLTGQTYTTTLSMSDVGSYTIEAVIEETGVSGTPNIAAASIKINVDENSSKDEYFPLSGDFNGDGLTDLGYYDRSLGIWKVMLAKADGTFGPYEYWIEGSDDFGAGSKWFYPVTADFNGDGKTDIGFIKVMSTQEDAYYMRIAVSNGKNFDIRSGDWRKVSDESLVGNWNYVIFTGDFNGDGITDTGQVNVNASQSLYVGLTRENLVPAAMDSWGSDVSRSDFSPIAADFNGDGLTDLCLFEKKAGLWSVMLSNGSRFGVTAYWLTNFGPDKDAILGDFNCDGLTDIGYAEKEGCQWSIKYAVSDGTKFNLDSGSPYTYRTEISDSITGSFITGDFNGDGLFDVAAFDKNTHEWTVKLHHSKFPDMLVEIDNGIGGKTSIAYKDSVMYQNTDVNGLPTLPFSIRVVSEVTQSAIKIGTVPEGDCPYFYTTRYFYSNGVFETGEREFRGFGYVKVIDAEGSCKETYFNQDDIYKGRPAKEVVRDKYNKIYAETLYHWLNRGLTQPGEPEVNGSDPCFFPYLADKTSKAYDPVTGENKSAVTSYVYDDYGNVTNVREEGFSDVAGDEKEACVTYDYDTARWLLSKPLESRVKDASGAVVAATRYEYYPDGSLKKEEKWLGEKGSDPAWLPPGAGSDPFSPGNPVTEFTYDACGNVLTVKDAMGHETTTTYYLTNTFPERVQNALGHTQTFNYNKATGKILTSTDPNGQIATSEYDGFGRQTRVIGPGGISEVTYTYDLVSRPAKITSTTVIARSAEGATKQSVKAFSFVDGLGRQILSRVEAEYKGVPKHIVSGEVKYDSRGQVIKKYLPYYIDVPPVENAYASPQNTTPYVSYEYDAMGRLVKTIRPDNKASYTIYGVTTIEAINENGQHARQTKDAYGGIVEVEEDGGSVANYVYDTLGNLISTLDSASSRNQVQMQYDTLGRKISMTDPDMGGFVGKSWQYYYDKVGNLTSQIDAKGQTISFQYDAINRLVFKSTGVTYTYDGPAISNLVGRLSKVTDSSGTTEFFYDILGRETKTTKTITPASYTIERTYDSVDRLVTVKYPDNSVVTYSYNKQGGISSLRGGAAGADEATYVSSVDYNANGQIERVNYGNGTHTEYAYDPYNFRLEEVMTKTSEVAAEGGVLGGQNGLIQHLRYNFDPIGNITSILDNVNTNTQFFQYDNLNRLTLATGASYGSIEYQYNSIGNLLKKGSLTMEYGQSAGPHAVTTLRNNRGGDPAEGGGSAAVDLVSLTYDPNGNMTSKGDTTLKYDVENRLKKVLAPKGGLSFDVSINLNAGWNFFSLPGYIPNTAGNVKDILASIEGKYEQVSTYNTAANKWKHYVNDPKFNQFDKFEYGKGYLIYMKEPATLTLAGSTPLTKQTSDLKSGWNLISAPTDTSISVTKALAGVTYTSLRGASVVGDEAIYDEVTTLESGKSYWVNVATDQTWSITLSESETKYAYDGDGGRVLRQEDNKLTVYIGSSYEMEGPAGQTADKVTKHIFMGSTRVCSIETSSLRAAEGGEAISHVYYYHQDHIGSSNVITNESGSVVQVLEYSPFGEVSTNSGDYSTDKRFTGKIYDESSALCYFGARYYDPELGRFITADPTVARPFDPQDLNRYSYCRNNPINYIDPTGYSWWSKFWDWMTSGWGAVVAAVAIIAITAVATIFTGGSLAPVLWGEIYGAIGGAVGAAATGGDIGRGMLIGTIVGGVTGGVLGGAGGGGSAPIGQTSSSAISYGTTDVALYAVSGVSTEVSTQTAAAGASAMQAIATSGAGAGAGVINGMVSNAYAAENSDPKGERKVSLEIVMKPLPKIAKDYVGGGDAGYHWGIRINDSSGELSGTWDFDYIHNPKNDISVVFLGQKAPGIANAASNKAWTIERIRSTDLSYITKVYGNIQQNLGLHYYKLDSYTCQTWVNNRLDLKNDNFN